LIFVKVCSLSPGLILSGLYSIASIVGGSSYTITASSNATSTVNNGGAVPVFTTTVDTSIVSVALTAHGLSVASVINLPISTTGNGVTISGDYSVTTVADANNFSIVTTSQATSAGSFSMNSGNAELVYYITLAPPQAGQGYGIGPYGSGLYGYGTAGGSAQTGTPITATDWSIDNWGAFMLASPKNGGIYVYDPNGGYTNAGLIPNSPPFNGGMFVSTSQQIVMTWGSSVQRDIGVSQDAMWVQWCTIGNYTVWTPLTTNQAGGYRIPIGSKIMGGMAVANQNLFWTDLDLWAANYQGPPFVFGFNKIGAGAGLISSAAAQQLRGNVYWMGLRNFYSYTPGGVSVIPCPVWDVVFQNLNNDYTQNVRAMPNTPFNEVGWLYPSADSLDGECDSYVKFNITEPGTPWDYGPLPRSAWIDQGALGMPIAATPQGLIYQHETTNDADGSALNASFTTGYFMLAEGEEFASVDQILPDMKWGTYSDSADAQVLLTFNLVDYPGDTPRTFGPYTVTQSTEYISVRFRGRQMSITVESLDQGSFWRLGRIRYRYTADGRR